MADLYCVSTHTQRLKAAAPCWAAAFSLCRPARHRSANSGLHVKEPGTQTTSSVISAALARWATPAPVGPALQQNQAALSCTGLIEKTQTSWETETLFQINYIVVTYNDTDLYSELCTWSSTSTDFTHQSLLKVQCVKRRGNRDIQILDCSAHPSCW